MPSYTEFTNQIADQIVDAYKQAEEQAVSMLASFNDTAAKAAPAPPGPDPSELLSANFALGHRLLDAQQQFVSHLIDAGQSALVSAQAGAGTTTAKSRSKR